MLKQFITLGIEKSYKYFHELFPLKAFKTQVILKLAQR